MSLTEEDKQWFNERIGGLESRIDAKLETLESRIDTKLEALESRIDAKLDILERRMDAKIDERSEILQNRLTEVMRDMQSELLRGFAAFAESYAIRLNKVETNQADLDKALSGRVQILESRLHQIELRLFGELGPGRKAS